MLDYVVVSVRTIQTLRRTESKNWTVTTSTCVKLHSVLVCNRVKGWVRRSVVPIQILVLDIVPRRVITLIVTFCLRLGKD